MDNSNDEVRLDLVTINTNNGDTQTLSLSSYDDETVLSVSEARENPKLFSFSKEQLEELHETVGKAIAMREHEISEDVLYFTNSEIQESLRNK